MKRVIHKSRFFTLARENKPKPGTRGKGPRYYIISWNYWAVKGSQEAEIRKMLDPQGTQGRNAYSVEYLDRARAEKLYDMLMLRWG